MFSLKISVGAPNVAGVITISADFEGHNKVVSVAS
jgi:hypothetical protein